MKLEIVVRVVCLLALGFCLGQTASVQAQELQLGIDFNTVIPRGEFKDNINNNGYGIGGQFAVRLWNSPLLVGADLGFVTYGSEKRREALIPTIPDVRVDVTTDNNIFLGHLLLRLQPREGRVRPYADGLIGLKYLFTQTSINGDFEDNPIASDTNFSDTTFSYGFGGGVQVGLNSERSRVHILLDGKVRYLRGSNAEYLKKGSITRENGAVFFDVLSSRTDVITVQVGVTFRF
jgi:opacity protein-like surface antigen